PGAWGPSRRAGRSAPTWRPRAPARPPRRRARPAWRPAGAPSLALQHLLLDRAEHRVVVALHLDADHVAVLHEARLGFAVLDHLDGALLGDAAPALGPVLVADGAAA